MENKDPKITVSLSWEQRDFLTLLQHEDAAANLSQAVAWCIDSCIKIEKLYGIDACYVAYNDIRNPANDPNPPASTPAPAIEGKEEDIGMRVVVVSKPQFSMICHDYWLREDGNIFRYSTDEGDRMPELPVEFYLLSNETIGAFEWFYAADRGTIHRNQWNKPSDLKIEFPFYYKIIATTDKDLKSPPIPEDRIEEYFKVNQISQPTPPAGAEGEGEIPFDVCTDIYNLWLGNKQGFFFSPPYQAGAIAMWKKMKEKLDQAQVIKESHGRVITKVMKEVDAAQTRIAALEAERNSYRRFVEEIANKSLLSNVSEPDIVLAARSLILKYSPKKSDQ